MLGLIENVHGSSRKKQYADRHQRRGYSKTETTFNDPVVGHVSDFEFTPNSAPLTATWLCIESAFDVVQVNSSNTAEIDNVSATLSVKYQTEGNLSSSSKGGSNSSTKSTLSLTQTLNMTWKLGQDDGVLQSAYFSADHTVGNSTEDQEPFSANASGVPPFNRVG